MRRMTTTGFESRVISKNPFDLHKNIDKRTRMTKNYQKLIHGALFFESKVINRLTPSGNLSFGK